MEANSLHDAKLVGVTYESGKVVRLLFETDRGIKVSVVLRGVHRFMADNLSDGNIVLDVQSTRFGNLKVEKALDIVKNVFAEEFANRLPKQTEVSEVWLSQIKRGDLHVFVVEPSYGAEVVAVCSDVEVTQAV